ncbi:cytochrome d ubiquinol oxidase subunit II [Inquilinus sp. KBS0705]|nr:cytochrome d ubiquinol oxidase subunit II [Inquilinus sp. KBS0705]
MIYVVIAFLWVSLLIYVLMGGADFGAGILELFTPEVKKADVRKAAHHAIGPIWEANHMWLIIAIVILFVGFPQIYTIASVYLHIPLVIMLLGIIARGTAFTFRNYDAVKDSMQKLYNKVYVYSSFVTPLFLGIISATAVSGRINTGGNSFLDTYIFDWLNWFTFAVGFFTVFLCGFLAAIYLAGEEKDDTPGNIYIYRAKIMFGAMMLCIGAIVVSSFKENIPLLTWLFGNTISIIAVCLSVTGMIVLWVLVWRTKYISIRFVTGFMVMAMLIAVTYAHYPNIILLKDGSHLSLLDHAAPNKTINSLGIALLVGSLFILPSLVYLVYSFGRKDEESA